MFDAETIRRAVNQEPCNCAAEKRVDETSVSAEDEIEAHIVDVIVSHLHATYGNSVTNRIEDFLNECDTSFAHIFQEPDSVADALYMLFGGVSDSVADSMLRGAFASFGFESDKGYTRYDIAHAVPTLRELVKQSEYGEAELKPLLVLSATAGANSSDQKLRAVAVNYRAEIPPSFIDPDGNSINVLAIWQQAQEHYPCPRDRTDDNVLVMTNRGIFLFCYDCRNFYSEGGKWGYKTSWAALERMRIGSLPQQPCLLQ